MSKEAATFQQKNPLPGDKVVGDMVIRDIRDQKAGVVYQLPEHQGYAKQKRRDGSKFYRAVAKRGNRTVFIGPRHRTAAKAVTYGKNWEICAVSVIRRKYLNEQPDILPVSA
jgi:hypothetical protein